MNEEAYEMMDMVVEKYLAKHKPKDTHSTIEMWKLREQASSLRRRLFMEILICLLLWKLRMAKAVIKVGED